MNGFDRTRQPNNLFDDDHSNGELDSHWDDEAAEPLLEESLH